METNKFKASPYNFNNHLITLNDITNIMENLILMVSLPLI